MRGNDLFLPDFCHIRTVFVLVLSGQLLAFVLVLAAPRADLWQTLALLSLLVQWILLASAAVLCVSRRWLARLPNAAAAALSYLLVLAITGVVSELGYRLLEGGNPAELRHGFVLRALAIAAIVAALVLRYLYVTHEGRRRLESEARARVDALQARIRPHFLFNSLNTILSMIAVAPDKAEAAVEDLADLFRASLAHSGRLVSLREELELARGYLRMEALRLDDRLRVEWDVDTLPADALLPPLTLQPLLENAVYYGIEPHVEPGLIHIRGHRVDGMLYIAVTNPRPPAPSARSRPGMGMAQDNIKERLRLAFGKQAGLTAWEDEAGYHVDLTLPYRTTGHEDSNR